MANLLVGLAYLEGQVAHRVSLLRLVPNQEDFYRINVGEPDEEAEDFLVFEIEDKQLVDATAEVSISILISKLPQVAHRMSQ